VEGSERLRRLMLYPTELRAHMRRVNHLGSLHSLVFGGLAFCAILCAIRSSNATSGVGPSSDSTAVRGCIGSDAHSVTSC